MYGYNPQLSVNMLDQKISELQNLRNNFQNVPQQAPVNIYNNTVPNQNDFKAHILNENEKVDEILVSSRTMFFDDKKGHLYIKELNGDIKDYEVVLPKDEKDLKIEELERRLSEYEQSNNDRSNFKKQESRSNDTKSSKD